ncbi:purple acid phosphatase family protein [Sphingomonas sp. 37zxx]|uniref:purple acid phosphatase family protein n=1 Tax=Sphingomonas sp. 37zxx TaxID=1550073 RepID=UPI000A477670|nr:metallophosphoesterase family protein [Sphingomonas sp. 37zxx]
MRMLMTAAVAVMVMAGSASQAQQAATVAVPEVRSGMQPLPGRPFAAKGLPDRVVLTSGADPARSAGVAWRTDTRQATAALEIAKDIDGPQLSFFARPLTGTTRLIRTENGEAHYHHARLESLEPDTAYVYRVQGVDGWSEWHAFRTAAAEFRPYTFLYFGDTQNEILAVASRVIRHAFRATPSPALAIHAGDLVSQRDDKAHDDEWGEWAATGGHIFASVPQLPATGNHEYVDDIQPDGSEKRRLGPHWPLAFALPQNGAPGVKDTTYSVDYQGVRFIILDGTSAIDLGTRAAQTAWLDGLLKDNPNRWTVALFHQPIYTCARPQDTAELKAAWRPVFEKHRIDLVLQGHDHCYGRLTAEEGKAVAAKRHAAGDPQGPVYLVSVTGAKMYGLNDRSGTQPDRAAEDTELWQRIDVEADKLTLRAFTATGRLYDGFTLARGADGRNRLTTLPGTIAERRCAGATSPDGAPCRAAVKD